MWRVGIDVGGTFTDLFAWEEKTGRQVTAKVLTTRQDRSIAVLELIEKAGIAISDVSYLMHGTTTATNALTRADLLATYPMLDQGAISHGWSGPIDRAYDSLPVLGHLKHHPNILYGIGWSGNGVGPSRLGGRILASLALGRDDEWTRSPLVGRRCKAFPPEPFRHLGGRMVRQAVIRKERAELRGRVPAMLDRLLARLAPAGLEDKS